MKKVIIVDDEKMIRVGIRRAISWESLGIDEVFLAADACSALDIIKEEQPELMITDINMPDITGLELIKRARGFAPDIRIIVLTGYDDFEYVRDSLRLAVNDFFLKPVDEDSLVEAIKKQMQNFETSEKEKQSYLIQTADAYKQANIGMRKLVKNGSATEQVTLPEQFQSEKARNIVLLAIDPSIKKEKRELEEYEIVDLCNGFLNFSEGELAFLDGERNIVILVNRNGNGEELTRKLRQMKSVVVSETGIRVQIIKGKTFCQISDCVKSYHDANELLLYFRADSEKASWKKEKNVKQNEQWKKIMAELMESVPTKAKNLRDALEIYALFERKSKDWKVTAEVLEYSSFYLASAFYYERKTYTFSAKGGGSRLEDFAGMIQSCAPEDIYLLLKKYITNLYREEEEKVPEFINKAKMIIIDSLTEDISVNSIAARLYISPGYLSRVFKASTGESCNNYIVRKRIEKAKDLLMQTDIPSGKIARMIGYKDSNYFSLAFKKSTGYSPQQYRQKFAVKMDK